jgi:hypothetical protein
MLLKVCSVKRYSLGRAISSFGGKIIDNVLPRPKVNRLGDSCTSFNARSPSTRVLAVGLCPSLRSAIGVKLIDTFVAVTVAFTTR